MDTSFRKMLAAFGTLLILPAMMLAACGDDGANTTNGPGPTTGAGGAGEGICLMNNCSADEHCAGCADGRNTCLVAENRCVACDPNTGLGCPDGEYCTSFGLCAPDGLTCPTDANGIPQVQCQKNADCKACSPLNQVCDTDTGHCQACTATNTQHCLSSDICIDADKDGHVETCSPKCPKSCSLDNDCGQCGTTANPAHACNAHKCAECSDTFPCAAGEECVNGVCTKPCGIPGPVSGQCGGNEDCSSCNDLNAVDPMNPGGEWTCKYPLNGGNHGNCTPPANGCSQLGQPGFAVLPPPYDNYTQLCSVDNDCTQANAGISYNVGKLIRDLAGDANGELNLGFTKVKISDANVHYGMNKCASFNLVEDDPNTVPDEGINCGICVPCKEDADCAPIDIDGLITDLFKDEPLAAIAGALLLDLLWGDNPDHDVNFFCQPVAFGYGACIPCGNPFQACGQGGGGGGNGGCAHPPTQTGDALTSSCGSCEATVCQADPFCCDSANDPNAWDGLCVQEANQMCASGCNTCAVQNGPLSASTCSTDATCINSVCALDPYCCSTAWDSYCVSEAQADSNCGC